MTFPQGDVHKDKAADLMETLGVGYHIWLGWNMQRQASSFNKSILTLVDEITSAGSGEIYIQPKKKLKTSPHNTRCYVYTRVCLGKGLTKHHVKLEETLFSVIGFGHGGPSYDCTCYYY